MLKPWIVILFINGQPMATLEQASEADCERARYALLLSQEIAGKKAEAACYLRSTKDESTAKKWDLPGPVQ